MFEQVTEFHKAFGLPVATVPTLPEAATRALRRSLLAEEYNEYMQAEQTDDLVEVADAMADICYILCGTLVSYGVVPMDYEAPFNHDIKGTPRFRDADLRKMLSAFLTRDLACVEQAENADDLLAIYQACLQMIGTVYAAAYTYSIPLGAVFNEVHRSNMSKLGPDGKPLRRQDGKVLKGPNYAPPAIAAILQAAA